MSNEKVRLVLKVKKVLRGKDFKGGAEEFKLGTVVFEGSCVSGFRPEDLEKALQMKEVQVDLKGIEEKKQKDKAASGGQKSGNQPSLPAGQPSSQK